MRKKFYFVLITLFFPFFLLHWNGLLSQTYYWALVAVDGTRAFLPQVSISFVSALLIFLTIAAVFELVCYVKSRFTTT